MHENSNYSFAIRAFHLVKECVELGTSLSPMFQFSNWSSIISLFSHLFTFSKNLFEQKTGICTLESLNLEQTTRELKIVSVIECLSNRKFIKKPCQQDCSNKEEVRCDRKSSYRESALKITVVLCF